VVFDGSVRDVAQLETIQGFKGWVRDWHPTYNYDNMLSVARGAWRTRTRLSSR
jgi:hypothetical protein